MAVMSVDCKQRHDLPRKVALDLIHFEALPGLMGLAPYNTPLLTLCFSDKAMNLFHFLLLHPQSAGSSLVTAYCVSKGVCISFPFIQGLIIFQVASWAP